MSRSIENTIFTEAATNQINEGPAVVARPREDFSLAIKQIRRAAPACRDGDSAFGTVLLDNFC